MNTQLLHTPDILRFADATLCESDSYYLLSYYRESFPYNIEYTVAEHSIAQILYFAKIFATFHGRVKIGESSTSTISSNVPIDVFRYKMLEDGSWYYIKTIPSSYKEGYIVEGAIWSNGMYYLVRDEHSFETLDAFISIDQYTKGLYNYP